MPLNMKASAFLTGLAMIGFGIIGYEVGKYIQLTGNMLSLAVAIGVIIGLVGGVIASQVYE